MVQKDISKVKQGKKNRLSGAAFERWVRKNLEDKGWIVFKNNNNVIDGEYKQGKAKFNPVTHALMMNGQGFPDFLCIGKIIHELQFIECKTNGRLSKEEKEKCKWIEYNLNIPIKIAYKDKTNNTICIRCYNDNFKS